MLLDRDADREMIARLRQDGMRGPWLPLLAQLLALAGGKASILSHTEKPWSSVTFSGSHHTILFAFVGAEEMEAGENFIAALPDHEFDIPRQIVADAQVIGVDQLTVPSPAMSVEAELLLLDDGETHQ